MQDIRPKRDGGPPTGPRVVPGTHVQLPQCKYDGAAPTFKNLCSS